MMDYILNGASQRDRITSSEIPPSLADLPFIAQAHKLETKQPLEADVTVAPGISHKADWMARQAEQHGMFGGKGKPPVSMTELLATPEGQAYLRRLLDAYAEKKSHYRPARSKQAGAVPALAQLLAAKSESDRRNYKAKHQILSGLLDTQPGEFVQDSAEKGMIGLTHDADRLPHSRPGQGRAGAGQGRRDRPDAAGRAGRCRDRRPRRLRGGQAPQGRTAVARCHHRRRGGCRHRCRCRLHAAGGIAGRCRVRVRGGRPAAAALTLALQGAGRRGHRAARGGGERVDGGECRRLLRERAGRLSRGRVACPEGEEADRGLRHARLHRRRPGAQVPDRASRRPRAQRGRRPRKRDPRVYPREQKRSPCRSASRRDSPRGKSS